MRVISAPSGLKLASSTLLLSIPLAAIQNIILTRAPWWKLPIRNMLIGSGAVALICIPIILWLIQGRRWAYRLAMILAYAWALVTGWVAIRLHHSSMGFFAVFLLFFFIGILFILRQEIGRSFFDPRMRWYEGLPKPIPGVSCQLSLEGRRQVCRVCRLDEEGAFIYGCNTDSGLQPVPALVSDEILELIFEFRDRQIRCSGIPVCYLGGQIGAGFQFREVSSDKKKELGDFIAGLRGEGYVE